MRLRLLLACAMLTTAVQHAPASALEVPVFASGGVTVYSDLTACATVTFPAPTTFAGSFSAAGAVAGPGTLAAPVAGVVPVSGTNARSWGPRCIPGAYSGATNGQATFVFHVSGVNGSDYVVVVQCTLLRFNGLHCV